MATNPEEMADGAMSPRVDEAISRAAGLPTEAEQTQKAEEASQPMYKMMPETKIPVSRYEAALWKARRDAGRAAISNVSRNWREAESYYSLGQDMHREETGGTISGNAKVSRNTNRKHSSTENVVYSNVNAMVPSILAKNPQAEITADTDEMKDYAKTVEHLVNRLATLKYAPGFNLKPKLRKCIVRCEITNEAWAMVSYTKREESADAARENLIAIGAELQTAKDKKRIEELEGQLMAIEETVDILNPAGPSVRTLRGEQVLVDPTSSEDDFSDANWMMAEVMMPTKYLIARYTTKNEADQNVALFEKSYIVTGNASGDSDGQDELNNFRLLKGSDNFENLGYSSKEAFDKAKMTKVWYCFDKIKRRFLLIVDEKWQWPLWVYDDPYQLPNFFPLFRLQYHTDPIKNRTKGEVSFYLDQQDEINEINSEINRMRKLIIGKVLYDARYIDKDQFDAYLKSGDQMAFGVGKNLPEGMKMQDVITAPPLPNMQYKELFSKENLYASIDRISSTNDILRGAQFKTNTTNDAIGVYNSIQNQRIDEKIDAIEDFAGEIFYAVMFLCAQFMTAEDVAPFLGPQVASQWQQREAGDIRRSFTCTVVGGSTQKPTSAAKKDQAVKIGQILGQFANASPYVTIIMLKMFQEAFDDIVITDSDWQMIIDSIQSKLQQGSPGAPGPGEGPSQPMPEQEGAMEPGGDNPQEDAAEGESPTAMANDGAPQARANTPRPPANHAEQVQLEMAIKKLPPQAQQAISNAVKSGVPQQEAFVEVTKAIQKQQANIQPTLPGVH